jgi:hypothetical protein
MIIMGIAVASTTGALQLMTRSGGRLLRTEETRTASSLTLHQMRSELSMAITVLSADGTSIQFTHPDMDNDLADETISYSWSGNKGDPLQRTYNGAAAETVLSGLVDFRFTYGANIRTSTNSVEGAEKILSSFDETTSLTTFDISSSKWIGQCFPLSFAADAESWSVTRILVKAMSQGTPFGVTRVQLRDISGNKPSDVVIAESSMLEGKLSGTKPLWEETRIYGASGLAPVNGACLVLQHAFFDTTSAAVQIQSATVATPGSKLVGTNNGGTSWTAKPKQDLLHYVYGTVTAPGPGVPSGELTTVYVFANTLSKDAPVALQTATTCLNQPKLSGALISGLPLATTP